MKGKLTKLMMVAMVLVMALSLVTTALTVSTTTVSAATDSWSRKDLPTTNFWQMAPNTDIWDLTAAADGTLFALVEDTSGDLDLIDGSTDFMGDIMWDGERWGTYPAWSDVALFKSTDGGYQWTLLWHIPSVETGAPIGVIPQPGYKDGDAANDQVFIATGGRYIDGALVGDANGAGHIYYSVAGSGAMQFTRVTPQNPGVALGGWITSFDVADCGCVSCPSKFMVVVGVTSNTVTGRGEGVYTWNRNGTGNWEDIQISNSTVAPPSPGTMPASNSLDVLAVKFAKWTTDKGIIAVANDLDNLVGNAEGTGVYVCFYDGNDGYWGGDLDSPTNVWLDDPVWAESAVIAIGTDYNKTSMAYVYVGLDGSSDDDVWRIRGLSTVMGPSTQTATGLVGMYGAYGISDVIVPGTAASGLVYAGCIFPDESQAQVFKSANINSWPGWTPSWKPPSGGWPVSLAAHDGKLWAAGGTELDFDGDGGPSVGGGVHVMVPAAKGDVFNGTGLLDDIAVSEAVPGAGYWSSPNVEDWVLAEAVSMDLSLKYGTDSIIYVGTYSEWWDTLSLWRWDARGNWERVVCEWTQRPNETWYQGWDMTTSASQDLFVNDWTWFPRTVPQFSDDPSMFLLGGIYWDAVSDSGQMLWYSPDKGDWWEPVPQMPTGADQNGGDGLSDTGWWVVDKDTVFLGDVAGWIYKTTNRGASWTQGVRTAAGKEIVTIMSSPIYSDSGAAGTDKAVLAGTFNPADGKQEVWISRDGCVLETLKIVGDEINTDPGWMSRIGGVVINFDPGWVNNKTIYASACGWLDRWEASLASAGGTLQLVRTDFTDVGLYRTTVNLNDPSASTWKQLWDADDFNANAPSPKLYANMVSSDFVLRFVTITGINFGPDGTMYAVFSTWDMSYNTYEMGDTGDPPSPNFPDFGRFTDAGVLRTLNPASANPEIAQVDSGLGQWDGLWLNGVAGGSNHIVSLAWDWKEWRFKLAMYEDTLSGAGPVVGGPVDGATGVGSIMADTSVSAPITWQTKGGATLYEWQVSEDAAFTSPKSGTTSGTGATVTGLKSGTSYYWRVRAVEPMIGQWSTPQQFTTVPGGDTGAPAAGKPDDGSTISDTTPLFTWGKVPSATNYEIQVATSPAFGAADIVINKTLGDVSAYEAEKELVNGTYYWRVRGTNPATDTASPWSFGSFTLDTESKGEGTPVWVWVLIIVGVVLAIIVLVLILRTRRPV